MQNLITFMVAGSLACILLVGCGSETSEDEIAASVEAQVAIAVNETPAFSDTATPQEQLFPPLNQQ